MDTLYKKLLLFAAVMVFSLPVMAQEKVSKKIKKTYAFTNDGEVYLDNKYGNINIYGWDKNEVSITVSITVSHKKKDNAQELLNRIRPVINDSVNNISVSYKIEEKSTGFFSNLFDKANSFDLDHSNIQVEYKVYMPKKLRLELTNKFGDVFIEDWKGVLNADVQHGDMWINENLNKADLSMKYGKIRAKNINYGNLNLNSGGLEMDDSKVMHINSNGSEIDLHTTGSLEIYSNKDEMKLEEVGTLYGTLKFSNLHLRHLAKDIDLSLKLSDLEVDKIASLHTNITIEQESSEVSIMIKDFSHEFKAVLEEGLVRLPKSFHHVNSTMLDKGKKRREIKATYGDDAQGSIQITGKKGVILLKEL